MSILTKDIIINRIKKGEIKIEPFDRAAVGPASIDLHLGNQFRIFKDSSEVYSVDENADFREITENVTVEESFLLKPGQLVHGITLEKITLPPNLCGWIEGRSSLGRLGLTVHATASFVQPGISNKQVLEMYNVGPRPLALKIGIAVCQLILEETIGKAVYKGKFNKQEQP